MKSPLTDKPLRNPGESLDIKLQDILLDEVLFYFLIAVVFTIMALLEWWRWLTSSPPLPFFYSIIAALTIVFAGWKTKRALIKVKRIRLGRDGEKAVGQYLDLLREKGARIFHDIQGNGFNLDHVVIHTSGVYVVETKTFSKPDRGEAKITYDGESILKQGIKPDRNPVIQVRASRKWLYDLLKESTGKGFLVRPVIVFPGWYIEPTAEAKSSDVWALNPKALPAFIEKSRNRITPEDVSLCAYHLSRHARAS